MKNHIQPCKCGSTEFVTKPILYDIYKIVAGKLERVGTAACYEYDVIKLYCRECGRELKNAAEHISNNSQFSILN